MRFRRETNPFELFPLGWCPAPPGPCTHRSPRLPSCFLPHITLLSCRSIQGPRTAQGPIGQQRRRQAHKEGERGVKTVPVLPWPADDCKTQSVCPIARKGLVPRGKSHCTRAKKSKLKSEKIYKKKKIKSFNKICVIFGLISGFPVNSLDVI